MTARDLWEAVLIECNKIQAPGFLLEDFNHFANKAIYQYINKRYSQFDVSQQLVDDLRVLRVSKNIEPVKCHYSGTGNQFQALQAQYGQAFYVTLPVDYLHLLNCVCTFRSNALTNKTCNNKPDSAFSYAQATRLSTDLWPTVINNYYNRPSHTKPYYVIMQNNPALGGTDNSVLYKATTDAALEELEKTSKNILNVPSYSRVIKLGGGTGLINQNAEDVGITTRSGQVSLVGNPEPARIEIRYGKDSEKYTLLDVQLEYLRVPHKIHLTQTQLDLIPDTSQILEWPDYVCNEIVNEVTHLIMENTTDQRLQTHMPIVNSIG